MSLQAVRIPKAFYDDHLERDCLPGVIDRETKNHYWLVAMPEAWADLLSDADYYSDAAKEMGASYIGLQASARATAAAIRKAGVLS